MWFRQGAYFLQQSLVQLFVSALQQAPQLAHFSAAEALTAKAATEAAVRRVRMVFMVVDVFVLLLCLCPLVGCPACGAGMHIPDFELAVRPDGRAGGLGGGL